MVNAFRCRRANQPLLYAAQRSRATVFQASDGPLSSRMRQNPGEIRGVLVS